jgi:pimeloyl-ACP methyl ester carboxylesterase
VPLLLALALLALFAAPAAAACPQQARCGTLRVPLDHSGATPGTMPLAYGILPASGPRTGTIVFLTGGPGEPAVRYAPEVASELAPVRATHDIVLVDQRGTGDSGDTRCGIFEFPGECAKRLGAKRPFLTTAETARDIEALRVALGIEKVTLLGVSYGTRVAGEYARRFPDRTAALILDSPVALDAIEADGLDGIAAMPRVLREVCAAGPCATTVDDAAAALNAAVRRVRRGDVRGPQVVSRKGRRATVEMINIGELRVYNAVQFASALGPIRSALPAALQSLARGDAAPLIHLSNLDLDRARPDDLPDEIDLPFSASRFHATMCLEAALPWRTDSALDTRQAAEDAYVRALGPKPFAPFSVETVRGAGTAIRCSNWPATPAPEPPPATTPDVPVLVLSGREDLVTPVEQAREVAATYPRATLLEIPHVGHSVMNDSACARAAAATFIAGTTPEPCAGDPKHPAAAYVPGTLRGKRAVAQATIDGVRRHLEASRDMFGPHTRYELWGQRGGYTLVRRGSFDLRDVEWVRRVRVSGRLSATGSGRLTLSGATHGEVRVRRFVATP